MMQDEILFVIVLGFAVVLIACIAIKTSKRQAYYDGGDGGSYDGFGNIGSNNSDCSAVMEAAVIVAAAVMAVEAATNG